MSYDGDVTWMASVIKGDNFRWIAERLVTIIGFVVIIWQVNKQFKNSQKLQAENKLIELKLKIYESIREAVDKAATDVTTAYTSHFSLKSMLILSLGRT